MKMHNWIQDRPEDKTRPIYGRTTFAYEYHLWDGSNYTPCLVYKCSKCNMEQFIFAVRYLTADDDPSPPYMSFNGSNKIYYKQNGKIIAHPGDKQPECK